MNSIIQSIFLVPIAKAQLTGTTQVATETQDQLTQLFSSIINKIPLWITAVIVLILTFVVARIVKSYVENKMATEGLEEEHKELSIVAGRTANALVLTIGITVALKIGGIDLTTIIAAGAFGIGFALKDIIMNFIAGVMILSARHYSIGDIIKIKGTMGKIVEIQTRATIVQNFDGTKVVIPNAELFKNPVTSYTSNPFRRLSIVTGVEYGSDLKIAVKACLVAAKKTKNALLVPKPSVWIIKFDESSINLQTNVWVDSGKGIIGSRTSLIQNIKKELDAVGITIPFPMRTIVYDKDQKKETGIVSEEKKLDQIYESTQETDETEDLFPGTNAKVIMQPQQNPAQEFKQEVLTVTETQPPLAEAGIGAPQAEQLTTAQPQTPPLQNTTAQAAEPLPPQEQPVNPPPITSPSGEPSQTQNIPNSP